MDATNEQLIRMFFHQNIGKRVYLIVEGRQVLCILHAYASGWLLVNDPERPSKYLIHEHVVSGVRPWEA